MGWPPYHSPKKRRRLQRDPLNMKWVAEAEKQVSLAGTDDCAFTPHGACVMGFLLFCLHTRSRCSDAARICEEPYVDMSDDTIGRELYSFIEASTTGDATKTGNTPKRARLEIPVTGLAVGISGFAGPRSGWRFASSFSCEQKTTDA